METTPENIDQGVAIATIWFIPMMYAIRYMVNQEMLMLLKTNCIST